MRSSAEQLFRQADPYLRQNIGGQADVKPFGIFAYLYGFYRVETASQDSRRLINLLMRRSIAHSDIIQKSKDSVSFTVMRKDWPELREIIDKSGILVYSVYGKGLPFFAQRYKKRVGFFTGALVFLLLVWLSTLFVWRVEIVSDTEMNTASVIENLRRIGISEGSFIPTTDCWAKSAEYLSTYDDCSWLSVNIVGTVAQIELRQNVRAEDKTVGDTPCNIVAEHGGVICSFVINSGKGYVCAGDIVKKGDLLVSGIIEDIGGQFRLIESDAEIYAETERMLEVRVDLAHTEKSYTGREKTKLSFRFFGLEFDIPFPSGEPEQTWEYGSKSEQMMLWDSTTLPVEKITRVWREYRENEEYYTLQQAREIADYRMNKLISSELSGAEILSVEKSYAEDEDSLTLTARIRCICDIATKKEIKKTGENDA